jgi:hypothetical protein
MNDQFTHVICGYDKALDAEELREFLDDYGVGFNDESYAMPAYLLSDYEEEQLPKTFRVRNTLPT